MFREDKFSFTEFAKLNISLFVHLTKIYMHLPDEGSRFATAGICSSGGETDISLKYISVVPILQNIGVKVI